MLRGQNSASVRLLRRFSDFYFIILLMASSIPVVKMEKNYCHELNDKNWRMILRDEWVVQFYTSILRYDSEKLEQIWQNFAIAASEMNINVGRIDVKTSPLLKTKFFINGLPAIIHVKNGEIRYYDGVQNGEYLMYWLQKKMFYFTQPISDWRHPDSIQMTLLAYIFQLPHLIGDSFSNFHIKFALPDWSRVFIFMSVILFVLAIHALGLMMAFKIYTIRKEPQRIEHVSHQQSNVSINQENVLNLSENLSNSQVNAATRLAQIPERPSNVSKRSENTSKRPANVSTQRATTSTRSTNPTTRPVNISRHPYQETRTNRNVRENDRKKVSKQHRYVVYNDDFDTEDHGSYSRDYDTSEASRDTFMRRKSEYKRTK